MPRHSQIGRSNADIEDGTAPDRITGETDLVNRTREDTVQCSVPPVRNLDSITQTVRGASDGSRFSRRADGEVSSAASVTVSATSSRAIRSWPLLVLAAPAAVAVWSGWVGIGQLTGFGAVRPLPGIWDSLHVDTAVTLPLGVEAYGAFALRAWLAGSRFVSSRTRRFARWSAIASLALGMAGQVAYHLLAQSRAVRAPWEVTTLVSCLPVLVLGMGAALAHMLHADTSVSGEAGSDLPSDSRATPAGGAAPEALAMVRADRRMPIPDQAVVRDRAGPGHVTDQADQECVTGAGRAGRRLRLVEAQSAAATLAAAGRRVSRRNLRAAGVRGSNADLGELVRIFGASPTP